MFTRLFLALLLSSIYTSNSQASTNIPGKEDEYLKSAKEYINSSNSFAYITININENDKMESIWRGFEILKILKKEGLSENLLKNIMDPIQKNFFKNLTCKNTRLKHINHKEGNLFFGKKISKDENNTPNRGSWDIYLEEIIKINGQQIERKEKKLLKDFNIEEKNKALLINTLQQTTSQNISLEIQTHILQTLLNSTFSIPNLYQAKKQNHQTFTHLLSIPNKLILQLENFKEEEHIYYLNEIRKLKKECKSYLISKLLGINIISLNYETQINEMNKPIFSNNYIRIFDQNYGKNGLKFEIQKQLYRARYYFILSQTFLLGPNENSDLVTKGLKYGELDKKCIDLNEKTREQERLSSLFKDKIQVSISEKKILELKIKDLENLLKFQKKDEKNLRNNNKDLKNKLLTQKENNKKLKNEFEIAKKEINQNVSKNTIYQLNQEINNLKQVLENEKIKLKEYVQKEYMLTKTLEEKEISLINMQKENEILTEKSSEFEKMLNNTNEEIKNLIESLKSKEAKLLENCSFLSNLESEIFTLENDNFHLLTNNEYLNQQLQEMYQENLFLKQLNSDLINENGSLHAELKPKKTNSFNVSSETRFLYPSSLYNIDLTNSEKAKQYIKKLYEDVNKLSISQKKENK